MQKAETSHSLYDINLNFTDRILLHISVLKDALQSARSRLKILILKEFPCSTPDSVDGMFHV